MKPWRLTLHCSATGNNKRVDAETIREWHLERGFKDIGYHFVVQPDGEEQKGRPLNVEGAHVSGDNDGNIGICLIGTNQFTVHQFDRLRQIIDFLIRMYDIKPWEIWLHREFPSAVKQGKTCPNMDIRKVLCWYYTWDQKAISEYLFDNSRLFQP